MDRGKLEPFRVEWQETVDVLPWQHIIVFAKKGADEKSPPARIDPR
jgi:hypothetical protein